MVFLLLVKDTQKRNTNKLGSQKKETNIESNGLTLLKTSYSPHTKLDNPRVSSKNAMGHIEKCSIIKL